MKAVQRFDWSDPRQREGGLAFLEKTLGGVLAEHPIHEAVDRIHETLLGAGLPEEEALELNRRILLALHPGVPRLRTFEVFLTRWCNLRCPYCFVHEKGTRHMTEETADDVVSFVVAERDPRQHLSIVFMGGEPTSRFDLLRRIVLGIERAIPRGSQPYRFDITSNGTLLTEAMMRFFREHGAMVLLSVDGDRETHDRTRILAGGGGSFDRIVKKLPMFRRYQPYMGTRMTVTPESAPRLLQNVRALFRLGFRKFIIGPATGIDWPGRALRVLRDQIEAVLAWRRGRSDSGLSVSFEDLARETSLCGQEHRWGCRAGRTGVAIDGDGTVYPCSKVIGVAGAKGGILPLGHVRGGITDWKMRLRLLGYVPTARRGCWDCRLRASCGGGCLATNFEATGDPFRPGPGNCRVTAVMNHAARKAARTSPPRNGKEVGVSS